MHRYSAKRVETVTFAQARALDSIRQQQVLGILEMRAGATFPTFDACAAVLEEHFGESEDSLTLERYEITREGDTKPSHEMWVYFGEAGQVFECGEGYSTPVYCVQRHFWSVDPDDETAVALAAALNESFEF